MPSLADRLVPDELWELVEPLLPPPPPREHGRAPRQIPDRACFAAVVFMGRTSTPWELLPARELGCGSYSTAYRRFSAWTRAGVFDRLSLLLLDQLGEAGRIDWRRVSVDSVSLGAVKRGSAPAQPDRPWQGRQQAPPGRRWRRDPARSRLDRCQNQRLGHVRAAAGRAAPRGPLNPPAALPAGQGPRRQGLRPPPMPPLPAQTRDQAEDRTTRDRVIRQAGPLPLEG